jgi:hypothetical protein
MNRSIILICLLGVILFSSCKKDNDNWLTTTHPAVPVTVTNKIGNFNGVPTVQTSVSGGGNITITLSIPSSTGRTIKEITRIGYHNTPNAGYNTVQRTSMTNSSNEGHYNNAPIVVNNTTYTFTTTMAEYYTKIPATGTHILYTAANSGTATSFLGRYFYFMITLDNGEQIIPIPVRVYVNT